MMSRRTFLHTTTTMLAGGSAAMVVQALSACASNTAEIPAHPVYGPLVPRPDATTGLDLLLLPAGFRYISFSWTGETMRDGHPTPPRHDGMAVIASEGGTVVLVRNHEDGTSDGAFGSSHLMYAPQAAGGTTTLRFNTRTGTWLDSWISLSGTSTNCAGGATPWGSWLTCEETVAGAGELGYGSSTQQLTKDHGWVFEVPAVGTA